VATQTKSTSSHVTLGSGADMLVLKLSETAYQGDAKFTVSVDGKQVGGVLTAKALHGLASDTVTLKGNWGIGAHKVSVAFLNDHWGGSAAADRNLYVDGITFNGQAVAGGTAILKTNGTTNFDFTKLAAPASGTGDVTMGRGADTLILKVSETAYQGDAKFTVSVDGKQVGGVFTAKTLHGAGSDTITINGDWGAGAHKISISFINDHWGGTAAADRNLYVDGITFNEKAVTGGTADLTTNGTATFSFSKPAVSSWKGDASAGSGANTLVLKVSETAYQGDAKFTISVDGKQIGGIFTAKTLHGSGSDTITLKGDWGSGSHKVNVTYINDHWGGTAATDRDLYVDRSPSMAKRSPAVRLPSRPTVPAASPLLRRVAVASWVECRATGARSGTRPSTMAKACSPVLGGQGWIPPSKANLQSIPQPTTGTAALWYRPPARRRVTATGCTSTSSRCRGPSASTP
jgi:hypothetical protein